MFSGGECRDCGSVVNPEYYLAVQCFGRDEEGNGRTSLKKYGQQNPRALETEKTRALSQIQADLVTSGFVFVQAGLKKIIDGKIYSKFQVSTYLNHPCRELTEVKPPQTKK